MIDHKQTRKNALKYLDRLIKVLTALRAYIKKDQITEAGFKRFRMKVIKAFEWMSNSCQAYFLSHYIYHYKKEGKKWTKTTKNK